MRVRADVDSGATLVFIGYEMASEYCKRAGVSLHRLPHPFRVDVANDRSELCSSYFVGSVEIPTRQGPVFVDNVVFYVMDCVWPELLIGFPVLDHLLATPDRRLEVWPNQRFRLPLEYDVDGAPTNPPATITDDEEAGFVIVNGEESLEDIIAGDAYVAKAMEGCPFIPASEFVRRREERASRAVSWSATDRSAQRGRTRTRKHYTLGRLGKLNKRLRLMKRRRVSELLERLAQQRAAQHPVEQTWYRSICPKVVHQTSTAIPLPQSVELPLENEGIEVDFEFSEKGELDEPEVV